MQPATTMVQVYVPEAVYDVLWREAVQRDTTIAALIVERLLREVQA